MIDNGLVCVGTTKKFSPTLVSISKYRRQVSEGLFFVELHDGRTFWSGISASPVDDSDTLLSQEPGGRPERLSPDNPCDSTPDKSQALRRPSEANDGD